MQLLSGAQARALEPALAAAGALLAPSTGILDSHAFMLALQGEAEGAVIAYRAPFLSAQATSGGFDVEIGGAAPTRLRVGALVNAAGLAASKVGARDRGPRSRLRP